MALILILTCIIGVLSKIPSLKLYLSYHIASLPNSWGRTYIILIPKLDNPKGVMDFRPISLCSASYE